MNRHYFNLEDDVMQEIIDGWEVPDEEVFTPDLAPVCAADRASDGEEATVSGVATPSNDAEPPVAPLAAARPWR